jgi:hypothetical protein
MTEDVLVKFWRFFSKIFLTSCGKCLANIKGVEYYDRDFINQGVVYSDDLFKEIGFRSLINLYKGYKKDK